MAVYSMFRRASNAGRYIFSEMINAHHEAIERLRQVPHRVHDDLGATVSMTTSPSGSPNSSCS